jgi:hypothetical protein
MNIFKKSLTEYSNWNKNYTNPQTDRLVPLSGWWEPLALRRSIDFTKWSANPW